MKNKSIKQHNQQDLVQKLLQRADCTKSQHVQESLYKLVISIDPHNTDSHYFFTKLAIQNFKWDEAIDHLTQITKVYNKIYNPGFVFPYATSAKNILLPINTNYNLQSLHKFTENYITAHKYLTICNYKAGHTGAALLHLNQTLLMLEYHKQVSNMLKIESKCKSEHETIFEFAILYAENDYVSAIKYCEKALKLCPTNQQYKTKYQELKSKVEVIKTIEKPRYELSYDIVHKVNDLLQQEDYNNAINLYNYVCGVKSVANNNELIEKASNFQQEMYYMISNASCKKYNTTDIQHYTFQAEILKELGIPETEIAALYVKSAEFNYPIADQLYPLASESYIKANEFIEAKYYYHKAKILAHKKNFIEQEQQIVNAIKKLEHISNKYYAKQHLNAVKELKNTIDLNIKEDQAHKIVSDIIYHYNQVYNYYNKILELNFKPHKFSEIENKINNISSEINQLKLYSNNQNNDSLECNYNYTQEEDNVDRSLPECLGQDSFTLN